MPTQTDAILQEMTEDDDLRFTFAANVAAKDIATCPESHRITRTAQWAAVFTYYVQDRIPDYLTDDPWQELANEVIDASSIPDALKLIRRINKGEYLGADHE